MLMSILLSLRTLLFLVLFTPPCGREKRKRARGKGCAENHGESIFPQGHIYIFFCFAHRKDWKGTPEKASTGWSWEAWLFSAEIFIKNSNDIQIRYAILSTRDSRMICCVCVSSRECLNICSKCLYRQPIVCLPHLFLHRLRLRPYIQRIYFPSAWKLFNAAALAKHTNTRSLSLPHTYALLLYNSLEILLFSLSEQTNFKLD